VKLMTQAQMAAAVGVAQGDICVALQRYKLKPTAWDGRRALYDVEVARPAIVAFVGLRRDGALRKVAMWDERYAAAERLGMEDEGMSARATARAEGASASPTGQEAPETPHPTQSRGGGEK
jgi:hypothetical protein